MQRQPDLPLERTPRRPLWRQPDFARLLAAATTSNFGTMMTALAVPWIAIDVIGARDTEVAALATLRMLPGVLFAFVAGAWVDRALRRPLLVGSDLVRALLYAAVPLLFLMDALSMTALAVLVLAAESVTVLFGVAAHAFLPSVVARDDLVEGNASLVGGESLAEAAGFLTAGWLARWITAPFVLAVDAATFVASALLLVGIRVPEVPATAQRRPRLLQDLREGVAELRRVPELGAIALAQIVRGAAWGIALTSYMLWVMRGLDLGMAAIGTIAFTGSLGSVLGSALAWRTHHRLGTRATLIGALALCSGAYLLIPLAPDAGWLGIACLVGHQVLGDTCDTIWNVTAVSTRQHLTNPALLGRVNGTVRTAASATTLAAATLATLAIESTGPRSLLFVYAALPLVAAALVASWLPRDPFNRRRTR